MAVKSGAGKKTAKAAKAKSTSSSVKGKAQSAPAIFGGVVVPRGANVKGSGKGATPEAAPVKRSAPRSATDDEYVSQARPMSDYPDIADVLPDLCKRYREIAAQAKELETERKGLSEQIMPLMEAVEANSIQGDGWVAVRALGSRSIIVAERLLEHGVSMAIIEKSTKRTEYRYVQVRDGSGK
jgi:hypothetical protein